MTAQKKKYTGSVYIGIVGAEAEYGQCRDSIETLARWPGDSALHHMRATKGYEARQWHINNFIATNHDFVFLMDADMMFPRDALERLRSHELPFVSGFYMRRNADKLAPVWYRPGDKFPIMPWIGIPEAGKLHKIGASGWGCMLVHRDVVLGVRGLLKGEQEVLEDDMDIWPYDLKRIMAAISGLQELVNNDISKKDARQAYIDVLKSEVRPLRCDNEVVGSDIRFSWFALQAGHQLYGDPDVNCGHVVNYPLSLHDYRAVPEEHIEQAARIQRQDNNKHRRRLSEQRRRVENA